MKTRGKVAKMASAKEAPKADEAAIVKAEFRREDTALYRAGRAHEVLAQNVAALGLDANGERPRLLSINGVRFRA